MYIHHRSNCDCRGCCHNLGFTQSWCNKTLNRGKDNIKEKLCICLIQLMTVCCTCHDLIIQFKLFIKTILVCIIYLKQKCVRQLQLLETVWFLLQCVNIPCLVIMSPWQPDIVKRLFLSFWHQIDVNLITLVIKLAMAVMQLNDLWNSDYYTYYFYKMWMICFHNYKFNINQ